MSGACRVVYDDIGKGYAQRRRPDARIARAIERALRSSLPVLNVGAGAGSWKRPHSYLDPAVRRSISAFAVLPDPTEGLEALHRDLADGSFWQRNAELLDRESMDYGYRLVIAGA